MYRFGHSVKDRLHWKYLCLRNIDVEKEPNSSIDIVENYIKDALEDNIDPEPTAYILNEMLPKLVNTLLKRTYVSFLYVP